MTKVNEFIETLYRVSEIDLGDMSDTMECINALMMKYGATYKLLTDLDTDEYELTVSSFSDDVEDAFCDRINTKNIGYYEFQRQCLLFMDFSKMYSTDLKKWLKSEPSEISNCVDRINKINSETRFSLTHKNETVENLEKEVAIEN